VIVCLQKLEVWSVYYQHNTTVAQKSRLNQTMLKSEHTYGHVLKFYLDLGLIVILPERSSPVYEDPVLGLEDITMILVNKDFL